MRAIVTGGAGFIGSHVVDALLARGERCSSLDDLSNGQRENVPAGARSSRPTIASRRTSCSTRYGRRLLPPCAPRSTCGSRSSGRPRREVNVIGTISVLEAARRHDTQVVFSRPEARSTASATARLRGRLRRPLAPYGVSKLAAEEYLADVQPTLRVPVTSRCASATSTGRARIRTARPAWSRSSSGSSPRASRRGSSATGARRVTTSTPGTWRRRRSRARSRPAASSTSAPARRPRWWSCTSYADGWPAPSSRPSSAPPRLGELQRSVLDVTLAQRELGWRAEVSLEEGLRRTWESIST